MLLALNVNTIIRIVSLAVFTLAGGLLWLVDPHAAEGLWGLKGAVLGAPTLIIFLLTIRPIFRWVHGASFARVWLFPLLDGEWEGEVHSNWPRIEAMMIAARDDGPRFNAMSDELPQQPPIPISAKIVSGLFDYRIVLRMSDTRWSYTVFVKPVWCKPDLPRLYYVYRQQEDGQVVVTDRQQHTGAAYLDFHADAETLAGAYWTERQSELGLNTAGRIRLRRKKPGAS